MKTIALVFGLLVTLCFGQGRSGAHRHDGFFLSLNAGPASGNIELTMENSWAHRVLFTGSGYESDFKIGGAVADNVILSADIISRTIVGPVLNADGITRPSTNTTSASDQVFGVGFTYYIMPANAFLSATLGMGAFGLTVNNVTSASQSGLGFRVKGGKEWWVSPNWGIGMALAFTHIAADDRTEGSPNGYKGVLTTNKVALLFNSTFN